MSKEQNFIVAGAGDMALGAWGLQKVIQPRSLFHSLFTYDVPVRKWISIINGTEEDLTTSTLVTSSGGELSVKTAANNGDVTFIHSRRHPKYQPNRGHTYATSVWFPVPDDNAVEDFGLFTEENGVFFRMHTDGQLYACIQSNGVVTDQELIRLPFELDYTKGNVFDIQYQWRGAGNYRFFAGNPKTGEIEVIHEFRKLGTSASVTVQNPALPASYRVTSLGDAGEMLSGCVDVTSEGGDANHDQYESVSAQGRAVSGTDVPVLIINNPATTGGHVNTRDLLLARISGASDKRSIFTVWSTRDPTAFTGASFTSAGHGSLVLVDVSATAIDTAKLDYITSFRVEANSYVSLANPAKEAIDFFIIHGDYLVLTTTVSSGTCDGVFEWGAEV